LISDFWAIFWVFEVDGIIFGCYKSVSEVFWGCNGLKIEFFFFFTKKGVALILMRYIRGYNGLKIKFFTKKTLP